MKDTMRSDEAGFFLACVFTLIIVIHAALCLFLYQTYDMDTFVLGALISQQIMLAAFLLAWHFVDKTFKNKASKQEREESPATQPLPATESIGRFTQFTDANCHASEVASNRTDEPSQYEPSERGNATYRKSVAVFLSPH